MAKCAAWPASCIRVVSAVFPLPIAAGSAREVKLVVEGCQVPSGFFHARRGLDSRVRAQGIYHSTREEVALDGMFCFQKHKEPTYKGGTNVPVTKTVGIFSFSFQNI